VEVRNGWQLWGEQYNRKLSDIFSVEEEISREISDKLRIRLTGEDRTRLAKRFTRSAEAYGDYLKGRYCWNKMTEGSLRESIGFFEQALEKDPGYPLAYAGLADSYVLTAFMGPVPPAEVMPRAKEAALKALALDESLAEAHAALASVRKFHEWDWQGAESSCRRALELNPNFANGHRMYASYLSAVGRHEEAVREILRAKELDPLSLVIGMEVAWHCYMGREYDRAIEHAMTTLEIEPAFPSAHHALGLAYEQKGSFDAAIASFEKAHAVSFGNPATLACLGHALAVAGRSAEAAALEQQLREMSGRAYVPPYYRVLVNAGLRRTDAAFACLEDSYQKRDLWLVWVRADPRLDVLRGDARFERLLRRVGLAGNGSTAGIGRPVYR
jgi:tetratricopeptide (TPR) repeat protein